MSGYNNFKKFADKYYKNGYNKLFLDNKTTEQTKLAPPQIKPTFSPTANTDMIKNLVETGYTKQPYNFTLDSTQQTPEQKKNVEVYNYIKNNPIDSISLSTLGGVQRGQTWGLIDSASNPDDKRIMTFAKEQNPYYNIGGEILGFATSPFTKLFGAGLKGVSTATGNIASKSMPTVASKLQPVLTNPLIQTGSKAAAELGAFESTAKTSDLYREGGMENVLNNKGEILQAGGQGLLTGAILGSGLKLLGMTGKNVYGNTVGFRKALENTSKAIDDYKFPQLREPQIYPTPLPKLQTVSPDIPIQYRQPLPKIEEPLMLPPPNKFSVPEQYRVETAGLPARNIKPIPDNVQAPNKPIEMRSNINLPPKVNEPVKTQINEPVKMAVNENVTPTSKYSPDVQSRIDALNQEHKSYVEFVQRNTKDITLRNKMIKGNAMEIAAKKRAIIQGDSLLPVEGGLTEKELWNKLQRLDTNYSGKPVITPDGEATATGQSSFGKVGVKFSDGTVKYYPSEKVQAKFSVDDLIRQQHEALNKPVEPIKQQSNIETPVVKNEPVKTQNIANVGKDINAPARMETSAPLTETIPTTNVTPPKQPPIPPQVNNAMPEDGRILESAVKTNTMQNKIPELQTPEGQKFAEDFEATYGEKTDAISIKRANEMIEADYNGTYQRILKDGVQSKEDNIAAWQITRDLLANKNFDEANKLIARVRPDITNYAQVIQSMNTVAKDSLEGIALRARRIIDAVEKDVLESNPAIKTQLNAVNEAVKKNMIFLDVNLQKFAENVDKELKQIMGKLYKKDYIDSIMKVVNSGKYDKTKIINAIKEKYGIPTFSGEDLAKMKELYDKLPTLNPKEWEYKATMQKIDNIYKDKLPVDMASKLGTYQFINLYGNTLTGNKILGGNIATTTTTHVKDILKAMIDNSISRLRGKPANTAYPSLKTKSQSFSKRFSEVNKDYKAEVKTDPFEMSYDYDKRPNLTFKNKFWREAEKIVNWWMAINENPFKQAIYDDELRMLMKKSNVSEPTQEMFNEAMDKAQKVMFANKTKFTEGLDFARAKTNEATNRLINKALPEKYQIKNPARFGVGNIVQPILRTPVNMFTMAFDYSPVGLLKARNQSQFSDQLAKAIVGSIFGIGTGYIGKKTGLISGGVPKDADARNFAEESGRQPYALNIPKWIPALGGKSMDLSFIQPFGMQQSFGAELASDNKNKQPLIAALDSLINNTMLTGVAKLLGKSFNGSPSENIAEAVTGGTSTMIPFSSLSNQLSKSFDTYKRDTADDNTFTRNVVNRTLSRTPFRGLLPEKITNTGEKIPEDSLLNTWISPGKIKSLKDDKVTNELMRLYEQANENKQFPPKAKNEISYKTEKKGATQKFTMTPEQLADFQAKLGKGNIKAIEKVMNTNEYQTLNDKEKADLISKEMSKTKQSIETEFLKLQNINEYKSTPKKSRTRRSR